MRSPLRKRSIACWDTPDSGGPLDPSEEKANSDVGTCPNGHVRVIASRSKDR